MTKNLKSAAFFNVIREKAQLSGHFGESQLPLELSLPNGELRAFLDPERQTMGLIVPIDETSYSNCRNDTRSKSIQITRLRSNEQPTLRLSLLGSDLSKVFYVFVDEFIQALSSTEETESELLFGMLQKWRRLFEKSNLRQKYLNKEQQMGLLCELEVLHKLIDTNGSAALNSWVGPSYSPHDFELNSCSIECKATGSANELRIQIHGSQQLESLNDKKLILVVRQYRNDPTGDFSIPIAFDAVCRKLPGQVDILVSKFQQLDYPIPDQSSSEFLNFTRLAIFEFDVDSEFPRVKGIDTEGRIKNLQYSIELSSPESVPGYKPHVEYI